jgi:DNA-binding NarL/FixJ family response regulator
MARASRIVVADSIPALRFGVGRLLDREAGIKIIGEARDRASLLKSVSGAKPDLVVADIFQREFSGLDLVAAIRIQHPGARVLVHTGYEEVIFAERAVRAGAAGYVMKREPVSVLLKAVRHILKDGIFVTPRATGSLLHQMAGHASHAGAQLQALSDRELEVLMRMGEGFTSREMAHDMRVSIKTVEAHREHIKSKLGLASGSALLRLAIQWAQVAQR